MQPRQPSSAARWGPIAVQMIGTAELDGIRATYEKLLRRHQPVFGYCHGCHKTLDATCPIFELAAANLELLELLDGSRFAQDWPGPVRERRW